MILWWVDGDREGALFRDQVERLPHLLDNTFPGRSLGQVGVVDDEDAVRVCTADSVHPNELGIWQPDLRTDVDEPLISPLSEGAEGPFPYFLLRMRGSRWEFHGNDVLCEAELPVPGHAGVGEISGVKFNGGAGFDWVDEEGFDPASFGGVVV